MYNVREFIGMYMRNLVLQYFISFIHVRMCNKETQQKQQQLHASYISYVRENLHVYARIGITISNHLRKIMETLV